MLDLLIFSKDRPLQLHALLSSLEDRLGCDEKSVYLVVYCSNLTIRAFYEDLVAQFLRLIVNVYFEDGRGFKANCISCLEGMTGKYVMPLMDDDLIIEKVPIRLLLPMVTDKQIGSLRLGWSTTLNYTVGSKMMIPNLQSFDSEGNSFITWKWDEGSLDWGYPWSLDGNIFLRQSLIERWDPVFFDNPNSLEGTFAIRNPDMLKFQGVAFKKQTLINLPFNKVQTTFANRFEGYSTDYFIHLWSEGYRIDARRYFDRQYNSPHVKDVLWLRKFGSH